jgi:hypothetical protein
MQDSQAFNGTVFGFRDRLGPAVEYRLSGLVGVQGIRFAPQPARGTVRAVHLQHTQTVPAQGSGEFGPVGACSFDTDGSDRTAASDEIHDLVVSGSHGEEFPVREGFAVFVDDGHMVCVGVGVDTGDDFACLICHDGTCPSVEING